MQELAELFNRRMAGIFGGEAPADWQVNFAATWIYEAGPGWAPETLSCMTEVQTLYPRPQTLGPKTHMTKVLVRNELPHIEEICLVLSI